MNFILNIFKKPTALQIAKSDLEEGQRQLLKHQELADYHAQMVGFHVVTNSRLDAFICSNEGSPNQAPIPEIKPVPSKKTKLSAVNPVILTP